MFETFMNTKTVFSGSFCLFFCMPEPNSLIICESLKNLFFYEDRTLGLYTGSHKTIKCATFNQENFLIMYNNMYNNKIITCIFLYEKKYLFIAFGMDTNDLFTGI